MSIKAVDTMNSPEYSCSATAKSVVGIGVPNWSGQKPPALNLRLFLCLGMPLYGRPSMGSRKARRCSIGTPTRVRSSTQLALGGRLSTVTGAHTMINPTQAMSEESSIVEIRRLEDTLTNIDGLASDGFSQIIAISQLALSSMENPSAYAHPERIAKALESIWHTAEHIQSCIFSETCEAGCQSSVTKEIRRLEARRVYEESIAIKRGRP